VQGRIGNSLWTGPLLKSATVTADLSSNGGHLVKLEFVDWSANALALRDVHGHNIDVHGHISSNNCVRCCAAFPPFEVLIGGKWTRVAFDDIAIGNTTLTLSPGAADAVRYAWNDYVDCVLVNSDGLPLAPFVSNLTSSHRGTAATAPPQTKPITSPPMGFNSWNYYHCNIDENIVKQIADKFASNGMSSVGYSYINIDDCWQVGPRDDAGRIVPDPVRFPSGMKSLADYVHSKGLKFGLYTARGSGTCQGRPGSLNHELIDAETYCSWGLDYIKIDVCRGAKDPFTSWSRFHEGLQKCYNDTGRFIVQSVETCHSPTGCGKWIGDVANLWRTSGDVQNTWASIMHNIHQNNDMAAVARPGHFNDPDMLQVGNVGLTLDEQRSHFALWCIAGAPLLAGTDIVHASNETLAIFTAPEVVAVNQDLGLHGKLQGKFIGSASDGQNATELWVKPMSDGRQTAIVLVNLDDERTLDVTLAWKLLGVPETVSMDVRDLWGRTDLGRHTGSYTAKSVRPHASVMLTVQRSSPYRPAGIELMI